ncbi:hypothetical protein SAMN05444161_7042 [Rhizobiales bacterium GAS191]|nr:hypothetical protein SAMN05444161_7042 [Rhizobiales bacterium GAS191]
MPTGPKGQKRPADVIGATLGGWPGLVMRGSWEGWPGLSLSALGPHSTERRWG